MLTHDLDALSLKLAESFPEPFGEETDAARFQETILRLLAEGSPVPVETIASATGRAASEVERVLGAGGAEMDEQGRLVGLGLTIRETPHRFTVGGRSLYTWCALDTLIFPGRPGARTGGVALPGDGHPDPGRGHRRGRRARRAGGGRRLDRTAPAGPADPRELLQRRALLPLGRHGGLVAEPPPGRYRPSRGRRVRARGEACRRPVPWRPAVALSPHAPTDLATAPALPFGPAALYRDSGDSPALSVARTRHDVRRSAFSRTIDSAAARISRTRRSTSW